MHVVKARIMQVEALVLPYAIVMAPSLALKPVRQYYRCSALGHKGEKKRNEASEDSGIIASFSA